MRPITVSLRHLFCLSSPFRSGALTNASRTLSAASAVGLGMRDVGNAGVRARGGACSGLRGLSVAKFCLSGDVVLVEGARETVRKEDEEVGYAAHVPVLLMLRELIGEGRRLLNFVNSTLGSGGHPGANRVGRAPQNPARQQKANPDAPPEPEKPDRKLNRAIVARSIRLITDNGHEVVSRVEALRRAEAMDLDLVEVDGKQDPPVCKLMDFNKERFQERQREKETKKKQVERRRLDDLKEVRCSTRTEPNDLELKAQMAKRLLLKGHRVKLAVIPHGNDELEPKGREVIQRLVTMLQETCKVETGPRIEKQRAWVLVRPTAVGDRSVSKRKRDAPVKSDSSTEDEVVSSEDDQKDSEGQKAK